MITACDRVPPGHRGVLVNLYGNDRGIPDESVGVGRYWTFGYKELYVFPTFLQNYAWKGEQAITMQTKEGLKVTTDAGITYRIDAANVVKVFQKYRLGVEEITNTFLHNMVRDAMNEVASTMEASELYGGKKDEFITKVNEMVKREAAENGIEVDKIYLVGTFDLPPSVVNSINAKIEATQHAIRIHNEIASTQAEAEKRMIEVEMHAKQVKIEAEARAERIKIEAKSQAEANRILSESLTPEFVHYQTVLRWDGKLPQITGNGVTPLLNFGAK